MKVDADLDEDELEERLIFFVKGVDSQCAKLIESMESQWDIELSPAEQLDELVYHFATGGVLDCPRQFHVLSHKRDGIWELKTPDLRLFGFFARKDIFICTDVADANAVKEGCLYAGYCEQAWFKRERLDLDDPKFVGGVEPKNVVSNCHTQES
ncbi:hypothetical protein [Erythrobacter sp. JK5]|uniref:hypothetical protein n=1 Tax=Erythrobacter sp. JK5 TaxID=2829500 RepID=UPI001BA72794|nr:hypothetical protein [Erythrobacter sp. JK5]QUL38141.1 hypothetical protein KDC96_01580 [Erythrobacter sp. JK5]